MSAMRAANTRICSRFAKPLVVPAPSSRPKLLKPLAPRVGVLESLSIDEDGEITWDVVLPNTEDTDRISWPSESVLDGYQLRPGQVPAAAPTSTLPTRPGGRLAARITFSAAGIRMQGPHWLWWMHQTMQAVQLIVGSIGSSSLVCAAAATAVALASLLGCSQVAV